MTHIASTFFISCLCIAIDLFLLVHLLQKKIPNRFSPMVNHLIAGLSAFIVLRIIKYSQVVAFDFSFAFALLFFTIAVCFFIFGAVYKSLSLRFLLTTYAQTGTLPLESLDTLVTQQTFQDRINILYTMGLATSDANNQYTITSAGTTLSNRIILLKKIFKINTLGLY